MARFGDFLDKQGRALLSSDTYALTCIAVLAMLPVTAWISASIIALLALRKSWEGSIKGLVAGIFVFAAFQMIFNNISVGEGFAGALVTFIPVYIAALTLSYTASWRVTMEFIICLSMFAISLILWLAPGFVSQLFAPFHEMVKTIQQEAMKASTNGNALQPTIISNYYLLGGWVFATVVWSAFISVLFARYVQARIFNPGGLSKEMMNFRASVFAVLLLIMVLIGAYLGNHWAMACLPILVAYFVCASLSVSFYILKKGRGIFTLVIIIIPIMIVPYIMLPIYTMLGAMDSLFNIRKHLPSKSDVK